MRDSESKHDKRRRNRWLLAYLLFLSLIAFAALGVSLAAYFKDQPGCAHRCRNGKTGMPGRDGRNGTCPSNCVNGTNGLNGVNGTNGLPGTCPGTCTNGTDGLPGRNGTDGTNGTNGLNGTCAATCTNGTNGLPGRNGTDGTNGTNGTPGTNGTNGLNGTCAASCTNGTDGLPGRNGTDGANGTNGTCSAPCTNGTDGLPGLNGTNGLPGTNGTDGTNGTNGVNGINGTCAAPCTNGTNGVVGSAEFIRVIQVPNDSVAPGTAFTVDTVVFNSVPANIVPSSGAGGTVFTLAPGVYAIDYEVSLGSAGSVALYKGATSGSLVLDTNSIAGSTTATSWIHGRSVENVLAGTQVFALSPVVGTSAVVTAGTAAGFYVVRLTFVQLA